MTEKDKEGSTYETYGAAVSFSGEEWPASGRVQAQQYGEHLSYIRNLRIDGAYTVDSEKGLPVYLLGERIRMQEKDGICLYTREEELPDYRILSIKPYRFLTLEIEKI